MILCVPGVSLSRDKRAREKLPGPFQPACDERPGGRRGERNRRIIKMREEWGVFRMQLGRAGVISQADRGEGGDGAAVMNSVQKVQRCIHGAPHPTDIHAPSKINFPFRPCSMFSSRPLQRRKKKGLTRSLTQWSWSSGAHSRRRRKDGDFRFSTQGGEMQFSRMGPANQISMHRTQGQERETSSAVWREALSSLCHVIARASWQHRGMSNCAAGHPSDDWCICSMVSAAGGNYQALSELLLHRCATDSGMPAKLCY